MATALNIVRVSLPPNGNGESAKVPATAAASRRLYLVAAAVVAAMTSCYAIWRYLGGVMPSDGVLRLNGIVTAMLLVTWFVKNPGLPATHRPSFDYGFFLWATFPLLAAYHMYKTQRWRGIAIIVGLLLLLYAPNISLALVAAVG